jgi:hypothetical protein
MKLNDVFDIKDDPIKKVSTEVISADGEVIIPHADTPEQTIQTDYDTTRHNLHNLLVQGQDALIHALDVAKSSEHPRAFEVVGGLMKQLADVNHQLLDLSEKRQKLLNNNKSEKPTGSEHVTNNNAIFVGSTTELNKMIKGMIGGN